jgi:hypothetical protein
MRRLSLPNRQIRDPFVHWCGRGEAVMPPPISNDMAASVKTAYHCLAIVAALVKTTVAR